MRHGDWRKMRVLLRSLDRGVLNREVCRFCSLAKPGAMAVSACSAVVTICDLRIPALSVVSHFNFDPCLSGSGRAGSRVSSGLPFLSPASTTSYSPLCSFARNRDSRRVLLRSYSSVRFARAAKLQVKEEDSGAEDEEEGDEDEEEDDEYEEEGDRDDDEDGDEDEDEDDVRAESIFVQPKIIPARAGFEQLGNKEKKELRAYAHGLGTKLNVQQVGKLGVTQTVVNSISDALEANEILKVKVLENCPSSMPEIIALLERGTGGQVVGKIGRTVLLYRASLRKLKASEKRELKAKPRPKSRAPVSTGRKSQDSERSRR